MFEAVRRIMGRVTEIQSTKGTGFKTPQDAQCLYPCKDNTSKQGCCVSHVTKHQAILQRNFSPTGRDKCRDRKAIIVELF